MKKCTHFNYFLDHVDTKLTDKGLVQFNYSAYSVDSSFYEEVRFNYCPFCGEKVENILLKIKTGKNKELQKEKLKIEKEQQKYTEAIKNHNQNRMDSGYYNTYLFQNKEYSAANKGHLKTMIQGTGFSMKKDVICIKRFANHKEQK